MKNRTDGLFLSPIFSDGMVLQRNTTVKIWGTAAPQEEISLDFLGKTYTTTADQTGEWLVLLEPMDPGGPWEMRIRGKTETIIINDVLVGDLWLLGGQSNMELPINRTLDLYEDEVKEAKNPFIREFAVPMVYDFQAPRRDLFGGKWKDVSPENVLNFGAVGYFFATSLYEKHQIPIGLIRAAIGGTPVEAWMSEEVIRKIGGYEEILAKCQDDRYVQGIITAEEKRMNDWYHRLYIEDEGRKDRDRLWSDPSFDDSSWKNFMVPNSWKGTELETINGSVWFRKELEVPEEMLDYEGLLRLGAIVDADDTYINGVLVGKTGYQYPPRKYPVPKGVLKAGKNIIAVQVISNRGIGGFVKNKRYSLSAGPYEIDLTGAWRYKVGVEMETLPQNTFFQYMPTGVYNGMIAPLRNYAITGFLWYQGESNTDHPDNYRTLFQELIAQWRKDWRLGDLPFFYVQLANFMASPAKTQESKWAKLRDEQRLSLSAPNTAMVVTIDVGEPNDLHPQNKKAIGNRLALCAERLVYRQNVIHQGPLLKEMKVRGATMELSFDSVGGGLVAKGGPLQGIELCGEDREFHRAVAEIIDERVRVSSERVKNPIGVRYAWADDPAEANLFNKEGLPASPFEAYQ